MVLESKFVEDESDEGSMRGGCEVKIGDQAIEQVEQKKHLGVMMCRQ